MKMSPCLVNRILVPWCSFGVVGAGFLWGNGAAAPVSSLESLASAYHESPTPLHKSALVRYADAHRKDQNGALARLTLGVVAFEQRNYSGAADYLKAAQPRLPKLSDYTAYYLAVAQAQSNDLDAVPVETAKVRAAPVLSPLVSRAVLVEADAWTKAHKPEKAIRILLERYTDLAQPAGDLALATSYQAAGDLPHAASFYQQVYYHYPASDDASKAGEALSTLRDSMGASYPPPSPQQMLERGNRLLEGHEYVRARHELSSMVSQLSGVERDQARVRIVAAEYLEGNTSSAYSQLRTLSVGESEADAERLYYLTECARRLGDDDDMMAAVRRLEKLYPESKWRFRALIAAGNRFLVTHEADKYEPLFQAAARIAPGDPLAAACHWKYVWASYIRRRPDSAARLREHLNLYPQHPTAGSALYFLGRLAEGDRDYGAARAYYAKLVEQYPNYYYGLLARERLREAKLVAATPSEDARQFLGGIVFPENKHTDTRLPTAATTLRIERARLLRQAGLTDFAQAELRFGARTDGQPCVLAVEMARGADSPYQALRYMKSLAPENLQVSFEDAPAGFWKYLFPLPYKSDLLRNARTQNLDPFVVAGLIRQESEFNPQALSYAKAYGLTQVRPATGRALARRAGVRRFSNRMLFEPSTNLKLGTMYLRSLLDQWGGKWEETLAAYNAGPSRAKEWLTWGDYREPAEFVESIPFTQTREYVQAVLRNAELYRRIYQDGLDGAEETPVKKTKPATKVARSRHKKAAKRRAG